MTTKLLVRVLGPLQVERAGVPLPLGGAKQRRLLAALVLAGGRTVSTDGLVEAVWGASPPASARNSLQSHVTRLRDALGDPDDLRTQPPGYALDTTRVEVDARVFEEEVKTARQTLDTDPAAVGHLVATALARWRGEAYAEFADDLAREEAVRLQRLREDARRLLAEARRRTGDLAGALEVLGGLVDEDPLQEGDVLQLARMLAIAGRVPDALAVLREHRDRLAEELGLDAGAAVHQLETQLLRGELRGPEPAAAHTAPSTDPSTAPATVSTAATSTAAPATVTPQVDAGTEVVPPPRPATPTLGRDGDQRRVDEALAVAHVVTLVGPGGVGKTRLAAVAAADASRAAWVDLTRVRAADDVAAAIVEALGAPPADGRPVDDRAIETLARFRGLVVLDNCEHLLDAVAEVVDATLQRGGPVRVLATSRGRLDVDGERVVRLAPLPVPDVRDATPDDPAVALFLARLAAAGGPDVEVADAAAIVAAVDGLPLAIELAAARAASLPIGSLVDQLHDHLDVLDRTRRRPGDRHATLRGVIDWSHQLMDEQDRRLYRRLAPFTGTFRLADVQRICADDQLTAVQATTALGRLVEASMVVRAGEDRFRLLEPVRVDAAVRLSASGERAAVEARQEAAALELADRAATGLYGSAEARLVTELEHALPDLRAVHARARARGDLDTVARLTCGLYRFAYLQARQDVLLWGLAVRDASADAVDPELRLATLAAAAAGLWMSGRDEEAQVLAAPGQDAEVADDRLGLIVTEALGDLAIATGSRDAALDAYERNRAQARRLGSPGLEAVATVGLAVTHAFLGDGQQAIALGRAGVALAEASGSAAAVAFTSYALGEALADQDPEDALRAFERSRIAAATSHARLVEGLARTADVALRGRHGDPASAFARYRETLELWRDAGVEHFVLTTLRNLVVLFARTGNDHQAVVLHDALGRLANRRSYGTEASRLEQARRAAVQRLGDAGLEAARQQAAQVPSLAALTEDCLAIIAATSG